MRVKQLAVPVVIAALAAITAAPALAHVKVVKTSPGSGKTASTSVESASVTFSGPIRKGTLSVTGPDGKRASVDSGGVDPRSIKRLLVELKSGLKAGTYKAKWAIVAADGHNQHGSFTFKLAKR